MQNQEMHGAPSSCRCRRTAFGACRSHGPTAASIASANSAPSKKQKRWIEDHRWLTERPVETPQPTGGRAMTVSNAIQSLKDRLARWRKQLRQLESGEKFFGTAEKRASSPNWRDATKERIKELKADIAAAESALKELERLE
jgi:hypothetical protein